MKLKEIESLLKDMTKAGFKQDKFSFTYNNVEFKVIFLADRTPFELLFGVMAHNFTFILKMYKGYELESIPDAVFYRLCNVLNLRAGKEGLTSNKFLSHFASKIPAKCSGKRLQPHEVAAYKTTSIPEADKIYFYGWGLHTSDGKSARNYEKTRELLGEDTYRFCKANNISSWWIADPAKRKDYCEPDLKNLIKMHKEE